MSLSDDRSFGIDLSAWQTNVDYTKAVADGVTFAIIRAGYGRNRNQKDKLFDTHYAGFRNLGIPVGAYQYAYATDVDGAVAEAEACIEWLKGKDYQLPIFYDLEEPSISASGKEEITEMAIAWCSMMNMVGYEAGVYANKYWMDTYIDVNAIAKAGFHVWCASWGTVQPDVAGLTVWQFGGETNKIRSNKVNGIGVCDQDYLVADLLNGSTNTTAQEPPSNASELPISSDKPEGSNLCTVNIKRLAKGDKGIQVKVMQTALIYYGFDVGKSGADGDFGAETEKGLKRMQSSIGHDATGICDQETWQALL